jgi:hypothetical protein
MLGLPPERVIQAVNEELTAFYRMTTARVVLVECNRIDAQQYADDLAALLGTPVSWTLLGALETARSADVFVVPYYHLDDVDGPIGGARVVGLHIAPDPAVLLNVLESAQRPGARVGLVCGNANSAKRFSRLFEFYTTKAIQIAHFRDPKSTKRLIGRCAKVFVTPEALAAVRTLARKKGVVLFPERIDPDSLGPLRALLLDLRETGMARADALVAAAGLRATPASSAISS